MTTCTAATNNSCVTGRLAESEDPVLFARFGEVDKCEFIKANAPVEEWSVTDDGAGLLVKTSGLREQAREVLVSAVRSITPISPAMGTYLSYHSGPARILALTTASGTQHPPGLVVAHSNRYD